MGLNRRLTLLARSRLVAATTAVLLVVPAVAAPTATAVDEQPPETESVEVTVAEEQPPVEAPAPAEEEPASIEEELAPIEQEPVSVEEEPAPVQQEPAPVEQEPAPIEQEPVSVEEDPELTQLQSERSDPAPSANQAGIGIMPLAAGDATIRVFKGADRVGTGCSPTTDTPSCRDNPATGLAGAVFEAYAKGNVSTNSIPVGAQPVATCTSNASGTCDLLVDSELGPRYVVREVSAPAGFRSIDRIALGGAFDSGTPRDYRWNVEVEEGEITEVPRTEIRNQSGQTSWTNRPSSPSAPTYQWADARDNPPLPAEKCGLNVAMLFDLSGSIGSNLPRVKSAATEFIDDLTGTPTSIALFTFSTQSPQNNGNSQNRPNLVSIADPADAARVQGWINGFSNASGGTNWDAGLRRVAAAGQAYDVLIVLTDGNPTAWEGERSSTGVIDDYDVENAVHSANWVKVGADGQAGTDDDTRIVAIGLSGEQGGLTALNLEHISGTVQNDDYYLTTFGDLADVLTQIALNGCGGTINVQKRIAPSFPAAEAVSPEPDWPFSVDQTEYVDPDAGTTGPNGEPLTFQVAFAPGQLARDVTIREPANQDDTVPVQDAAGNNARCLLRGQPLPADRIQNAGDFGFTVADVRNDEIISCLVVNSDARLEAIKYEDTNGNGSRDPSEPGLSGWTIFLDENDNAVLDDDEESLVTDDQGTALFERLEAPQNYRVCEVLQPGFFNTDPGGGALCKDQQVELGDSPAGPVLFGNVEAGGFTLTKDVVDEAGFVPTDTTYTVEVTCTLDGSSVPGFDPQTYSLTDGQTVTVGPLPNGAVCDINEVPVPSGAQVDIEPASVTVGQGGDVEVIVTNTYPVGFGEVVKVVDGPLAGELAPPGTEFGVEVSCEFPVNYPAQGAIPGFDPRVLTVESGQPGLPGPPVEFGPLPIGSVCTAVETDENGADPFGVTPDSVTITEPGDEPVQFIASNTYRPASLRINKVVDGPGAALVPPATVYVADVVCTFQGETTFDGEVEFGVDDPGIVSGQPLELPVGTECTITEADSQGATWSPQTQTVELVGDDPVLVDVTITNTFEAGELTVTKAVDDGGTGLVPEGTQYTVNVACTFDGNSLPGYPQDVVLTTPDSLSTTLTGLPFGTECTLSEQDLNGAESVTFDPSDTITIDEQSPSVGVTATNSYSVGTFTVSKVVVGPGASFVPDGTSFTVEVSCQFADNFPSTGEVPGFDPRVLTVTDGETAVVGPLPVGTFCTVEEGDAQGAGSTTVAPDSVTVAEGDQNVDVVVTNSYPAGSFAVTKLVSGLGANFVPIDTEYTVEVSCRYPDGFPASGAIPGFDPLSVVLRAPTFVREARTAVIGPLPVGSECEIDEPDPVGAGSVTIEPSSITVADGEQNVEVTVTNTYPAGLGRIVKVTTGPLAGQLAPAGTVFLVEVSCQFPPDFPAQGDIPGFSPRELAIEAGPPGEPGTPTEFGPLPVGSTCTVVETESNGAQPVDITPPGGTEGTITIGDPAEDAAEVTVTNTFNPAALMIMKEVTGPGAALLPPETVFTAQVVCTFQGQTTFEDEVAFSIDNPGEVTDQPEGASCTVSETESNGAPTPPPQTVVLDPPPDPVVKEVTFVNEIPAGELLVQKEIAGEAAGVVPDGVEFTVAINCAFQGKPLTGYPQEVVLATPDRLSQTLTGLPVGAECFGIETDDGGATSVEYDPPRGPQDPAGQSGTVTITPDQQEPVTITVRNVFDPAVLRVVKDVQPEGVLIPPGQIFTAFVECTFEGESIYSGDLPFGVGSPGVVSGLIVGSECTVTESESQGATFDPPSQTVTVDGDTDPVTVDVTITNTFQVGELTVEKVVDDPSGFVGTQTQYTVTVACTFAGQQVPGYPQDVVLTFDSDPSQTLSLLPFGTECVLSEADLVGASSVSFDPSDRVTIGEQGPAVTVTAVNTYPAGTVAVTKAIAGDGAAFVPAGTEFEVTATCTLPEDFPGEDPAPYVLTVTDGSTVTVPPTGSLPVGTVCTVEETDAQGASSSTIVPDSVTVGEGAQSVEVTVTNVYPVGSFPISKEVAGEGAGFVPADTEFGVGVTCEFLGSPVAGFDPFEATLSAASTVTVGPLPVGATCNIVETESNGAGLVSVVPDTVTVGQDEVPVEVVVTNTYDVGSLVIRKVVIGSGAASATDPFEFDIACTFLGTDLDPQPDPVTITPPATSAEVDGLPIGTVCAVTERAPYGGADGPPTVDPGSVTIGADGPVTVTVTNTFTAPPQPPAPHLPATGVTGLGPLAWGSALLIATGGLLALLARRRTSV